MEALDLKILEQAIHLLAETCKADMKILFVADPSAEDIAAAEKANAEWEAFSAAHPEVEEYANSQGDR